MARRRRNKRYRRGRLTVLLRFFSFLVICAAIAAALILFFKVETIEVAGNLRYTEEQVLEVAGIEYGENMFLINKYAIADRIAQQLPYVQSVRPWRHWPNTIVLQLEEGEPIAVVAEAENAWLISAEGKLLERIDVDGGEGYPRITGCKPLLPTEGSYLSLPADGHITDTQLLTLLEELKERDMLTSTSRIDCTSAQMLVLRYAGRFDVQLPYDADYGKKLYALEEIIKRLQDNETGTVILTLPDRSFFKPDLY